MKEQSLPYQENENIAYPFEPNYSLDHEALNLIEYRMVEEARKVASDSIVVGWVDPRHEYSNFLRTIEAQKFPEVDEIDEYYENHQIYIALIDTRGEGKVVHAATIMEFDDEGAPEQRTGYYTIDSLIELSNFTKNEFVDYYAERDIELDGCLSVETNFKIVEQVEPYLGMPMADLTYLTIFNLFISRNVPRDNTLLFASINELQAKSLERNNIEFEPLLGRMDFHTEEADLGKVSNPIAIYLNQDVYDTLSSINVKLPEIYFDTHKEG